MHILSAQGHHTFIDDVFTQNSYFYGFFFYCLRESPSTESLHVKGIRKFLQISGSCVGTTGLV